MIMMHNSRLILNCSSDSKIDVRQNVKNVVRSYKPICKLPYTFFLAENTQLHCVTNFIAVKVRFAVIIPLLRGCSAICVFTGHAVSVT